MKPHSDADGRSRSLGLLLLFLLAGCSSEGALDHQALAATSDVPRLIVIGLDGASWNVIGPMMERGELPNLQRLVDTGSSGPLLSYPPLSSPVVWTTIATGSFPRDHNVLHFTHPYDRKNFRTVEATVREVPAVWTVASQAEKTVGIVNYYVTFPAEVVQGFMVSDAAYSGVPASVYPTDLAPETRKIKQGILRDQEKLFGRFLQWDYEPDKEVSPDDPEHLVTDIVRRRVDRQILKDAFAKRVSAAMISEPTDLFVTYYRLVDHTSHAAWFYHAPEDFVSGDVVPDHLGKEQGLQTFGSEDEAASALARERLHGLVEEAYRFADECVGDVLSAVGQDEEGTPRANIVILSDHGFGSALPPWGYSKDHSEARILSGNHRPEGVLLAAGPDIRKGRVEDVDIFDVFPTLLALMRLPIPEGTPGQVGRTLFRDDRVDLKEEASAENVDSWEFLTVSERDQKENLETLQALGYIDSASSSDEGSAGPTHVWNAMPVLRSPVLAGEMLYYFRHGNMQSMERLLETARERLGSEADAIALAFRRERDRYQAYFDEANRSRNSIARKGSSPSQSSENETDSPVKTSK